MKYEVVKTPGASPDEVACVVVKPQSGPGIVVFRFAHVAIAKDFAFIMNAAAQERENEARFQEEQSRKRCPDHLPT